MEAPFADGEIGILSDKFGFWTKANGKKEISGRSGESSQVDEI